MHGSRRLVSCAAIFCLAAAACRPDGPASDARARLASALRDSLGRSSDARVAFITDGGRRESHLYVMLDTAAVPHVSDSAFAIRARSLAGFVMRHYDNARALDSVTISARTPGQPGVWKVHHVRAFGVREIGESVTP